MIMIPSVPHTASSLLSWIFKGKADVMVHIDAETEELFLPCPDDAVVIVPQRNPALVLDSFLKREQSLSRMYECYETMIRVIHPLKPHYIFMDEPDRREIKLVELEGLLGITLNEGRPIRTNQKVSNYNMKPTPAMEAAVPGWIMDYYRAIH